MKMLMMMLKKKIDLLSCECDERKRDGVREVCHVSYMEVFMVLGSDVAFFIILYSIKESGK